jgi:TonB family protein
MAESIKIRLELDNPFMGMEIVMPEEPVEEKKEKEIDPLKGEYADMSDVKNVKVNRDMELNSALKDSKGSDAKEIYDQARELEEKMKSSRAAYEAGLRELEEHKKKLSDKDSDSKKEQGEQMSDYKGNVTVSYSLEGRKAMYLHVPAYTCRNGGKVEIAITVNRRGEVIAATVARGSSSDESLREAALDAARRSRFDVSQNAPEKQTGKIYYTFIPQ